jgi:hypothetical protein
MKPPYIVELMLEGLIRDPKQRDALLGDLAEEWVRRATVRGENAANRWYCWQAVRALPHLARDASRQARWTTILLGVVLLPLLRWATLLLGFGTSAVVVYPLARLGVDPAINSVVWAVGSLWSFAGGMIVARVFSRSPMPAAVVFAFVSLITAVGVRDVVTMGLNPWYMLGDKLIAAPAALAGAIYVLHRRRRAMAQTNPLSAHG